MKTIFTFLLIALFLNTSALAQKQIGAHIGHNIDNSHFLLGADARLPMSRSINGAGLTFNPSLEYNFGGYGVANADVLYQLRRTSVDPYIGLGLGYAFDEGTGSLGLNMKGGLGFKMIKNTYKPFAELGLTIDDGSILVLRAGVMKKL